MTPAQPRFEISAQLERRLAIFLIALLVVAKIAYAWAYRVDSDETQHLHVVWGWAHGFLPYRDLFDNHSPLFQFLCSPLVRLLGERADIVLLMRWVMIPLYFLCLWMVYRLGTILYSPRLGVWAAILTGAYPIFFTKSTEFRTDDLWALLWLVALFALSKSPLTGRNAFLAGLALGACFATSMKTSALFISLSIAVVLVLMAKTLRRQRVGWMRFLRLLLIFLAGTAIVPAVVLVYFAGQGALPNLYYCVIQHNLVAGFFRLDVSKRIQVFALPILLSVLGAWFAARHPANDTATQDRRMVLALASATLALMFGLYWPIIEPHDILPLAPLVFLAAAPALARALKSGDTSPALALPFLVGVELVVLLALSPPRLHAIDETTTLISDVLKLTTREDYVMDAKGESVFRRRAIYPVLEGVTLRRLELGLIKDDIPERLMATSAPVASVLRTPPRAHEFIEQNYIPVSYRVRVLGKMLALEDHGADKTIEFEIMIPANYMLVAERGDIQAVVDGTPWRDARWLARGGHQVTLLSGEGRIAVVLASAVEKGFSPFSPQARDVVKGPLY
jgi:hypothetical protein